MTLCVKLLGQDTPSGQTIFARGLISVVVVALIAWRTERLHLLKTSNWSGHALRSLSGTVSMFCLFAAVTMIPLADVTAITFTAPMFITLLAMVFLGERIHRYRWTALILGFVGVLIMIGPHLSFGGQLAGLTGRPGRGPVRGDRNDFPARHERRRACHHDHILFLAHVHGLRRADCDPRLADADVSAIAPDRSRRAVRRVRPTPDDVLLSLRRSVNDRPA